MRLLRVDRFLSSQILTTKDRVYKRTFDNIGQGQLWEEDGSINSAAILDEHWHGPSASVAGIFDEDCFLTLNWAEFTDANYAVFTYSWGVTTWDDIIQAIIKKGSLQVQYVWIDILCLDQNDPAKMETIKRTADIYRCASEYHVFGFNTFSRGWCQCELASGRDPIFYEYKDFDGMAQWADLDAVEDKQLASAHREGTDLFDFAKFSFEDDRPVVRGVIEESFGGDMAQFDAVIVGLINSTKFVRKMQGKDDADLEDYDDNSGDEEGGTLGTV